MPFDYLGNHSLLPRVSTRAKGKETVKSDDGMAGFTSLSLSLAELDESEYLREVFGQDATATEADIEKNLTAKAKSLGIDVEKVGNPTALGTATTTPITHQRSNTISSTDDTIGTETATGTDNDGASNSPATLTQTASRKRSNTVNFSQYDKFLTKLEPALHQPKFSNPAATTRRPSHNIFGFHGHFKGVRELRRSLTGRLTRRKTHPASAVVLVISPHPKYCEYSRYLMSSFSLCI